MREKVWWFYRTKLRMIGAKKTADMAEQHPVVNGVAISLPSPYTSLHPTTAYEFSYAGHRIKIKHLVMERSREKTKAGKHDSERSQIKLMVDDVFVFRFEFKTDQLWSDEYSYPQSTLGDITRFLEGDWMAMFDSLVSEVEEHDRKVQARRQEKAAQMQLEAEMVDFGIALAANATNCRVVRVRRRR